MLGAAQAGTKRHEFSLCMKNTTCVGLHTLRWVCGPANMVPTMNDLPTVSARINDLMTALKLSQRRLGIDADVERSTLNRCLNLKGGKEGRHWRREHLARIAPVLKVSLEDLLKGTEEEKRFATEGNAPEQIKEMEGALAEAITRAQELEAQLVAAKTQLEAAQQALDNRPTHDVLDETKARLSSAEERERAAVDRARNTSKRLEEENAKRQAAEKERDKWRSNSDESVKLANKNHQAAKQNSEIAAYWKAQFDAASEQLKKETARANLNGLLANGKQAICDRLAAEKQAVEKRALEAESSASSAKGLAFLTTTLGAISLLSRVDD